MVWNVAKVLYQITYFNDMNNLDTVNNSLIHTPDFNKHSSPPNAAYMRQ